MPRRVMHMHRIRDSSVLFSHARRDSQEEDVVQVCFLCQLARIFVIFRAVVLGPPSQEAKTPRQPMCRAWIAVMLSTYPNKEGDDVL
jgi:hypothetical protein